MLHSWMVLSWHVEASVCQMHWGFGTIINLTKNQNLDGMLFLKRFWILTALELSSSYLAYVSQNFICIKNICCVQVASRFDEKAWICLTDLCDYLKPRLASYGEVCRCVGITGREMAQFRMYVCRCEYKQETTPWVSTLILSYFNYVSLYSFTLLSSISTVPLRIQTIY